jgi:protein-disulfide isomerase
VSDSSTFANCIASTHAFPQIDARLKLGQAVGVHGTPTMLINGWRFNPLPSDTELVRIVSELSDGNDAFKP